MDVHTTVGDMQVFVRELGRSFALVTGQGTVQCHLPKDASIEVDARVEIGRIGNGFGFVAERVSDFGAALVGRQGDGRTKVVLSHGFRPPVADTAGVRLSLPPAPVVAARRVWSRGYTRRSLG